MSTLFVFNAATALLNLILLMNLGAVQAMDGNGRTGSPTPLSISSTRTPLTTTNAHDSDEFVPTHPSDNESRSFIGEHAVFASGPDLILAAPGSVLLQNVDVVERVQELQENQKKIQTSMHSLTPVVGADQVQLTRILHGTILMGRNHAHGLMNDILVFDASALRWRPTGFWVPSVSPILSAVWFNHTVSASRVDSSTHAQRLFLSQQRGTVRSFSTTPKM